MRAQSPDVRLSPLDEHGERGTVPAPGGASQASQLIHACGVRQPANRHDGRELSRRARALTRHAMRQVA
jgi:hypothetical protein